MHVICFLLVYFVDPGELSLSLHPALFPARPQFIFLIKLQKLPNMNSLTVLEAGGGNISGMIARKVRELPENSTARGLTFLGSTLLQSGYCPDLLVIAGERGKRREQIQSGRCGILLVPGTAADMTAMLRSSCVVSYGMSKKDSVTISSIDKDSLVLSLQRELPTLLGRPLERQDIPIRCFPGAKADEVIASVAALLLLGVPPEELGKR